MSVKSEFERQIRTNDGLMWEQARFILADVPLHRDRAKKILPLFMGLADPPRATLFIADYTKINFSVPYHEAAMLIHVRTPLGRGVHCPWMVVDDDTALIYGRELLGYPKKMGQFTVAATKNTVSGSMRRRGVTVLSMKAERLRKSEQVQPVLDLKTFNAGGLGQFFLFNPIWLFRPREIIHESCDAAVTVAVKDSIHDPIAALIDGKAFNGRTAVIDIPGSRYQLPVGMAGPRWLSRVFMLRYR